MIEKETILVQKFNMDEVTLDTVLTFYKEVKNTLPPTIKTILLPHTWEFTRVDNKTIFLGLDTSLDVNTSSEFIDMARKALGDEFTIVSNLCKAEVSREGK